MCAHLVSLTDRVFENLLRGHDIAFLDMFPDRHDSKNPWSVLDLIVKEDTAASCSDLP